MHYKVRTILTELLVPVLVNEMGATRSETPLKSQVTPADMSCDLAMGKCTFQFHFDHPFKCSEKSNLKPFCEIFKFLQNNKKKRVLFHAACVAGSDTARVSGGMPASYSLQMMLIETEQEWSVLM